MIGNEFIFVIYGICVAGAALGAALVSRYALITLTALCAVLMNMFVCKSIVLCGWTATAADVLDIGSVLCLNLLQEFYGSKLAKHAIVVSFGAMLLYTLFSILHCAYVPSCEDVTQCHFVALLCPMPRLMFASITSHVLVQIIDWWLYARLNILCAGRYFVARNVATICLTQMIDTTLFGFLGLYGMLSHLGEILVVSYVVKMAALGMAIPFLACTKFLRRHYHEI